MITIQNYFEKKDTIDWSKVSAVTKENLQDIELLIHTAIDLPDSLAIEEIKAEIDVFLAEMNTHVKKRSTPKRKSKASLAKKDAPKTKSPKRLSTKAQIEKTTYFKKLVPYNQQQKLIQKNDGKNDATIVKIEKELEDLPKEPQGKFFDTATVFVHYYGKNTDWYITDIDLENDLLYGYKISKVDDDDYGIGYFPVEELTVDGGHEQPHKKEEVELNFTFKKESIKKILHKHFPNDSNKPNELLETPKSKAVVTPKSASKKVSKVINVKTVDHYSIEYRLLRRFYNLVRLNKTTTFRKIQLLHSAFQNAPLERSIRKTNANAALFTKINAKVVSLFKAVNPTKSDARIKT
jgi:hypothetical protein